MLRFRAITGPIVQYLASYFGDPGIFSMVFSIVFQASTGKKFRGRNHGKNHGTRKFDAEHLLLGSRGKLFVTNYFVIYERL